MKKILFSFVMVGVILGCNTEKKSESNILKITIPKDIGKLEPHFMTSPHYVQDWLYEGLVTLKNGEIYPMLSKNWEISNDGKEYIFYLREDIFFNDETKFNSNIVKKNFEEILKNKKGFTFLQSLKEINSIEIIDEYTIKFKLNNPCNSFLKDLTFSRPLVFLGEKGFETFSPIGTGMWMLESYEMNQFAIFKRNEKYWGNKPQFEILKTYVVSDMNTSIAMLRAKDIDMIYDNYDSLSMENIEQLKKEGYTIKISEPKQVTSLSLNTSAKILKDKSIRQALSYATNKEIISKEIFNGIRKPADCYFTKDVEYIKELIIPKYDYNIDRANQILDEANWKFEKNREYRSKDGEILNLKLRLDNSIKNGKIIAEVLQHQYKKVGIKLEIIQEESKLFRQNWQKGNFDIIMFNSWGGSYEPFATLAAMVTAGDKFNIVQEGIKNKDELHRIMKETLKENNESKLKENFNYIINTFYNEAIYIPLVDTVSIAVYGKDLEGVEFSTNKELIPLQNIKRK